MLKVLQSNSILLLTGVVEGIGVVLVSLAAPKHTEIPEI